MTLSCGSGKGRALIFIEGDIFFMSLYQIIPIFNKKITRKSFRNDFGNFCENVPTEFELQDSRQAEFSFHKLLMITHEISHHFCVDSRWNRQNRPILTLLKSRLTCRRFSEHPFTYCMVLLCCIFQNTYLWSVMRDKIEGWPAVCYKMHLFQQIIYLKILKFCYKLNLYIRVIRNLSD